MAGEDRIAERLKEVEDEDAQANGGISAEEDTTFDDGEITIEAEDSEDVIPDPDAGAVEKSEDDEQTEEGDGADPETASGISTEEMLDADSDSEEMSVAERLGTAVDFEKRALKLRRKAIAETEQSLAECFERDVDVTLDPQEDGTLRGSINLPGLQEDLDGALDEQTNVVIDALSVTVGNLDEE